MQEKVTVMDIRSIKSGESVTFYLPSELARHSARSLAYQVAGLYPREDIVRYECKSVNSKEDNVFPITITAIAK